MAADGLTKGAVDRKALDEIMNGLQTIQHPSETWIAPDKPPGAQAIEQNDDTQRSSYASRRQQTYISNRLTRSLCFLSAVAQSVSIRDTTQSCFLAHSLEMSAPKNAARASASTDPCGPEPAAPASSQTQQQPRDRPQWPVWS